MFWHQILISHNPSSPLIGLASTCHPATDRRPRNTSHHAPSNPRGQASVHASARPRASGHAGNPGGGFPESECRNVSLIDPQGQIGDINSQIKRPEALDILEDLAAASAIFSSPSLMPSMNPYTLWVKLSPG